jgi:hypothetical protein
MELADGNTLKVFIPAVQNVDPCYPYPLRNTWKAGWAVQISLQGMVPLHARAHSRHAMTVCCSCRDTVVRYAHLQLPMVRLQSLTSAGACSTCACTEHAPVLPFPEPAPQECHGLKGRSHCSQAHQKQVRNRHG